MIAAFGQVLDISEGSVHFPKVPADQPYIRVVAEREIYGNTQVKRAGVLIDGPVRRPIVEAFTQPLTTEERALALLERFGMSNRIDHKPAELSIGERQRVALVRTLLTQRPLLLLDEPLGALDALTRMRLQQWLLKAWSIYRKTVLMVTHDIAEAVHFGGVLVLMKQGRVVQRGSFAELVRDPAEPFVEEFITAQKEPLNTLMEAFA